jgi:hypothetical protein
MRPIKAISLRWRICLAGSCGTGSIAEMCRSTARRSSASRTGVDLSGERVDGDTAEVMVTKRISLLKHRFHLVKESGWKVCDPFEIVFDQ